LITASKHRGEKGQNVNRLIGAVLTMGLMTLSLTGEVPAASLPSPEPYITLLDLHPVDAAFSHPPKQVLMVMPNVVRQGQVAAPDPRQVEVPVVQTPPEPVSEETNGEIGRAGTGFFIGSDGTLLTAAHVVEGCGRAQIISRYVARTWVSLIATDPAHDIAVLKSDSRPPSVARLTTTAPSGAGLLILGFPEAAGLTVPAEAAAVMENQKFPANIGPLANPRELVWMSAPGVTHGFSGGPIFDRKLGAVVGIVKGEVDGGYLRLVRDMPTTGVAIGPGIGSLGEMLRRQVPYSAVSLVSSPGEAGVDTLRRATVHVLCWN
jgi:uncharacterized protein